MTTKSHPGPVGMPNAAATIRWHGYKSISIVISSDTPKAREAAEAGQALTHFQLPPTKNLPDPAMATVRCARRREQPRWTCCGAAGAAGVRRRSARRERREEHATDPGAAAILCLAAAVGGRRGRRGSSLAAVLVVVPVREVG